MNRTDDLRADMNHVLDTQSQLYNQTITNISGIFTDCDSHVLTSCDMPSNRCDSPEKDCNCSTELVNITTVSLDIIFVNRSAVLPEHNNYVSSFLFSLTGSRYSNQCNMSTYYFGFWHQHYRSFTREERWWIITVCVYKNRRVQSWWGRMWAGSTYLSFVLGPRYI